MRIPANEREMNIDWLAECLEIDPGTIESVQVNSPDKQSGLFGAVAFLSIQSKPHANIPSKLVCKFVPPDSPTAVAVKEYEVFAREENFYRNFAPRLAIRTPKCFASKYDARDGAGFLLLEDCSDFEQRDVASEVPCSLSELKHVVRTAARLCSSSWNQPWLVQDKLAIRPGQKIWEGYFENMQAGWQAYLNHSLSSLASPGFDEVARELVQSYVDRLRNSWPQDRLSLSHVDFHCGNYFYDSKVPDDPIVVFDWQGGAIGRTTQDLGSIIVASFPPEFRREHELELVEHFLAGLDSAHSNVYTKEDCWSDYEQGVLLALRLIPMFVTELDLESEYGAAVGSKVVRNLSTAVMDFGGMEFLDRLVT